jgi:hypothetical protein
MDSRNRNEPKITVLIDVQQDRHAKAARYSLGSLVTYLISSVEQLFTEAERLSSEVSAIKGTHERAARADPAIRRMELRADSVEEKVADLDARLNEVMACLDTLIAGRRQEERDIDHHSFQREFTALVNQDIGMVVDLVARDRDLAVRERAWLTARICWLLFAEEHPVRDSLLLEIGGQTPDVHDRCERILAAAEDLRLRVGQHGNQHWDFSFQPGMPVDPAFQELWPSYPGGDRVEFVVVPSYVIDGFSILSKQRVYATGSDG